MLKNLILFFCLCIEIMLFSKEVNALSISAVKQNDSLIIITSPGMFEINVTKEKGFGHKIYDLKNDPNKNYDLAPVNPENGLFWTKLGYADGFTDGSWHTNPSDSIELLESGPARVKVRTNGYFCRYGYGDKPWLTMRFSQTYTLYPTGDIYIDYAILAEKDTPPLNHFIQIIKSNGAWGPNGSNEVYSAGEFGSSIPYGSTNSSFGLQWSNGPNYFEDILMVFYKGRYKGAYWNEGYLTQDYRVGFWLYENWQNYVITKGTTHIPFYLRLSDNINGSEAAKPFANDYRAPDRLTMSRGSVVNSDEGDRDGDGYNEEEGCYVLNADSQGAEFLLKANIKRMNPCFKIKSWVWSTPQSIRVDNNNYLINQNYSASANNGILIIKLYNNFLSDTNFSILGSGSGTIIYKKGDLNNSGKVDVTDLGILLSNWGATSKPAADINQDGKVDVTDLGILLSNWG